MNIIYDFEEKHIAQLHPRILRSGNGAGTDLPEPGSLALLALGIGGLIASLRRRQT
jgi:hypothetical protein